MSEWWTYRPGDFLMFSARSYYKLVERYHTDVWPLQVLATALGLAALGLALRPRPQGRDRAMAEVAAVLGVAWLWAGWGFHHRRFGGINSAADFFAWAFVFQGLALLWAGVVRGRLDCRYDASRRARVGVALVACAVIGYPLGAVLLSAHWAQAQAFGVMPDPTAIATLGFLLLARPARPGLMLVPVAYCVAIGATLLTMDAAEGWLPLLAAALAVAVAGRHGKASGASLPRPP